MIDVLRTSAAPDRLLTVAQVAAMLAISVRTVWKLCSTGDLPQPLHLGGSRRWRESDITKYIESLAETQRGAQ